MLHWSSLSKILHDLHLLLKFLFALAGSKDLKKYQTYGKKVFVIYLYPSSIFWLGASVIGVFNLR